MLCSHFHRAGPNSKYAERGSTRSETRSHRLLASNLRRRNVHGETNESPITVPKTGRSLCHPMGAPGAYSVTRTCRGPAIRTPTGSVAPRRATDNSWIRKRQQGRNPLFSKRWFSDGLIILCVRWYLRFRLSYRNLSSIVAEMGVAVAPSTILRWVIRYTEDFVRRRDAFELTIGRSWRADETYIKVRGGWVYLYRAVDERGRTVAST